MTRIEQLCACDKDVCARYADRPGLPVIALALVFRKNQHELVGVVVADDGALRLADELPGFSGYGADWCSA